MSAPTPKQQNALSLFIVESYGSYAEGSFLIAAANEEKAASIAYFAVRDENGRLEDFAAYNVSAPKRIDGATYIGQSGVLHSRTYVE